MRTAFRVLCADALLTFLEGEKGASTVRQLLIDAVNGKTAIAITTASLGEVYASIARAASIEQADRIVAELTGMNLDVVDGTWELARQAAQFRTGTGAGEIECLAAALAYQQQGSIVTSDPAFQKLSKHVEVEWLPRR